MHLTRTGVVLRPNNARVLCRPFEPTHALRAARIVSRVMELSDTEVEALLGTVLAEFHGRHQRLLVGSFCTQEYALESAALFNPSIVWHPDQGDLPGGARRFIVSLRATGEGHVSSVGFRAGTVDGDGTVRITPPTGLVAAPHVVASSRYDKALFLRKLVELGVVDGSAACRSPGSRPTRTSGRATCPTWSTAAVPPCTADCSWCHIR